MKNSYGEEIAIPRWVKVSAALGGAAFAVIMFLLFCYRQVEAGEIGIITRGGDVNRTADAGPLLKLPWPIESFTTMDVKVQAKDADADAASRDLQDAHAKIVLNYHLNAEQALDVFSEIGVDYENRVIAPALQEVFKAATAQYTAAELITKRQEVKADVVEGLESRLADYGVIVDDVSLTNFSFSPEFAASVEARQVAEQAALQAKAKAAQSVAEAQGRLDSAKLDAAAAQELQATLTPLLLQSRAIEKWNGVMPQFMSGEGGTLFQIPVQPQQAP